MITRAGSIAGDATPNQGGEGGSTPPQRFDVPTPRIIRSDQTEMFAAPAPIGYGDANFRVESIDRDRANKIVMENHYSGKFYNASYIHLGVFRHNEIVGVLQFGYAMNPASAPSVVSGTELDQYLELNRMWLCDSMPHGSESRAISYAIKYIRQAYPRIGWIQSFADERCGKFGCVYQACSFSYCGEHTSTFWILDGVWYHNSLATRRPELSKAAAHLQANIDRADSQDFRQFRYIKLLHAWARKRLLLPILPYPKPNGGTN